MAIRVTEHGKLRGKQRTGLTLAAFQKIAGRAFDHGLTRDDFRHGCVQRWLDWLWWKRDGKANNLRIYGHHVYFFANSDLVTVWEVPVALRPQVNAKLKLVRERVKTGPVRAAGGTMTGPPEGDSNGQAGAEQCAND